MTNEADNAGDWMSANDAMIWEIERDPVLRSPITAVMWFDVPPSDDRIDAMIDRLIANMPRLSQRVVPAPLRLSTPRWEKDPHFDTTFHVRRLRLSEDHASRRDVLDHAQRIAARAFDKDRPPWEIEFLSDVSADDRGGGGTGACVMRFHHSIADGLGLVSMLQHAVDFERDPDTGQDSPATRVDDGTAPAASDVERLTAAVTHRARSDQRDAQRALTSSARATGEFVRSPLDTARRLAATGTSIAKVMAPATKPLSPVMTGRSTLIHLETIDADLEAMHAAAKSHGASINDAFVTITADGLDRYHQRHGEQVEAIRMHMPVSIRRPDEPGTLDNQFTPTRFVLPLDADGLVERLADTRTLLREVRSQPALPHTGDIAGIVRRLGGSVSTGLIGSMMRGVDVTTTNVPGPPFPVFIAGSEVTEFFGFGPLAGSAINLTFFSYSGRAQIGVSTDVAAVNDPAALVEDLDASIAEFAALA